MYKLNVKEYKIYLKIKESKIKVEIWKKGKRIHWKTVKTKRDSLSEESVVSLETII